MKSRVAARKIVLLMSGEAYADVLTVSVSAAKDFRQACCS